MVRVGTRPRSSIRTPGPSAADPMPRLARPHFLLAIGAALVTPAAGQSLVTMDTAGNVDGFTDPAGACNYPGGPQLSQANYVSGAPPGCAAPAGPVPGPPALVGDIAVNLIDDTFWITDGFSVTEYDSPATAFNGFDASPGIYLNNPITGLGFNSAINTLWMTDGVRAIEVIPPSEGTCPSFATTVTPPFDLPVTPPNQATDISWDPITSSLFVCDDAGFVHNVLPGGAAGPFPTFQPATSAPCALGGSLQGLVVDRAANVAGTMWVTDGSTIYYVSAATGGPANPTFYAPNACSFGTGFGTMMGLAANYTAIGFGSPSGGQNPFPFPFNGFPAIGSSGHSIVPNPGFELAVAGARVGELGALYIGVESICPGIPIDNGELLINLGTSFFIASFVADENGLATVPLPLPPGLKTGVTLMAQMILLELDFATPFFGISTTRGLAFTTTVL